MALKVQSSFSAGELDPALHERTTLEKYKSALKTLRNCMIGKTGRIISRSGRNTIIKTKLSDRKVILYSPSYSKYLVEWGHLYVRIHEDTLNTGYITSYIEVAHDFTEDDLQNIQFASSGLNVYVFCAGKKLKKFKLGVAINVFYTDAEIFYVGSPSLPAIPTFPAGSTSTGTGYGVGYAATTVYGGQESYQAISAGAFNLPINNGEINNIKINCGTTKPTEVRVYRRPWSGGPSGGAFGYIGLTGEISLVGSDWIATFSDIGQEADYSHTPPDLNPSLSPINMFSKTGTIYQQRLIISRNDNKEAIETSRPGYQTNFLRDYPLSSDSALTFKAGTNGNAEVLRMIDDDGLVIFTTAGIFVSNNALTPTNLSLNKKGGFVIDEKIEPVSVPGSVMFVDKATNTIRTLSYSQEANGYLGEEVSIFSNHLFENKKIVSWSFQDGNTPVLWVVFDDGTAATLTYQREHEMKAWARHDSNVLLESVATIKNTRNESVTYFVTNKNGERYIEATTPRQVSDLKFYVGTDSSIQTYDEISGGLFYSFTLTPVVSGQWDGQLTLSADQPAFINTVNKHAAGNIFRFFDSDGSAIDLEVITFTDSQHLIVQPSLEFPSDQATNFKLYRTYTTITGLAHLNGESVTVYGDGYVLSSPNNNEENYPTLTVSGGSLTLPVRSAIVTIGRPYTCDVETLDIDTVEQRPTLIESKTVNKLYIKIYNTRGLFADNKFPKLNKNKGMVDLETMSVNYEEDEEVLGNASEKARTKRLEILIPGDWKSEGRICLRQVDPLPFEILSIIPDVEDMRRK